MEAGAGEGDGFGEFDELDDSDELEDVEGAEEAEELPLWPSAAFEALPVAEVLLGRSAPPMPTEPSLPFPPSLVPGVLLPFGEVLLSDASSSEDGLSDDGAFSVLSDAGPLASAPWAARGSALPLPVLCASVALGPEGEAPGASALPVRGRLAFPVSSSSESARPATEQRPRAMPPVLLGIMASGFPIDAAARPSNQIDRSEQPGDGEER